METASTTSGHKTGVIQKGGDKNPEIIKCRIDLHRQSDGRERGEKDRETFRTQTKKMSYSNEGSEIGYCLLSFGASIKSRNPEEGD